MAVFNQRIMESLQDASAAGVVPEGEYILSYAEDELKENSKQNGYHLRVKFEVVAPHHQKMTFFETYNLFHETSATARSLGQRDWLRLLEAMGVPEATGKRVDNTNILIGRTFKAQVGVTEGDPKYPPQNTIKRYISPDAQLHVQSEPTSEPQPQAAEIPDGGSFSDAVAPTDGSAAPWDTGAN